VNRLRLKIGPVIQNALDVKARVEKELPTHSGLISLAQGVASAAHSAELVAQRLRRPLGLHRLPVAFLLLALICLFIWIYMQFYRTTTLRVAVPNRDALALRKRIQRDDRLTFEPHVIDSDLEAAQLVTSGKVDLAFIQGGIDIGTSLPRLETPNPELVLWFVRARVTDLSQIKRVLTSVRNSGSHTVAQTFIKAWNLQVEFVHDWKRLTDEKAFVLPDDIDAVFVVKDPSDEKTLQAAERLAIAGFQLASADLGARATQQDYLSPQTIPAGYLHRQPPFPGEATPTYRVATYLVAREGMTPRMLAAASHLLDGQYPSMSDVRYEPTISEASELFQGVDAFLGIFINLVLAFLALTGLEMLAYRKRFHELNSLVSLISIHQSSKDVLAVKDSQLRHDNLLYLSLCSDLLGLISMIGGYYTQENSSLLFSGLPEIIHQRCDGLKINIQLKILHAMIDADVADVQAHHKQEPAPEAAEITDGTAQKQPQTPPSP
jgi:hypothetical protein